MNLIKTLPKSILALGLVSFFTDISSEMIYPLLPIFLISTLGASPAIFGLIDGFAEMTAAVLKGASGTLADTLPKRKPLVVLGYSLSSFFRPLVGLAASWPFVFLCRVSDRIGKGIRSAPRDALIADTVPQAHRAHAYSLHRSMDHAGALLGPLIATLLLLIPGMTTAKVFLWAAVPAAIAILILVVFVKESDQSTERSNLASQPLSFLNQLKEFQTLGPDFRYFLFTLFVFSLGNASDAFFLLRMQSAGLEEKWIPVIWAGHSGIKMISVFYLGPISDSRGHTTMILKGWFLATILLFGFAVVDSIRGLIVLFMVYGAYYGLVEAPERAWISTVSRKNINGSAFGAFHMTTGFALLPANLLFGWLWTRQGPTTAFAVAGLFSLVAMILFARRFKPPLPPSQGLISPEH